jgi:hypothetical protein
VQNVSTDHLDQDTSHHGAETDQSTDIITTENGFHTEIWILFLDE